MGKYTNLRLRAKILQDIRCKFCFDIRDRGQLIFSFPTNRSTIQNVPHCTRYIDGRYSLCPFCFTFIRSDWIAAKFLLRSSYCDCVPREIVLREFLFRRITFLSEFALPKLSCLGLPRSSLSQLSKLKPANFLQSLITFVWFNRCTLVAQIFWNKIINACIKLISLDYSQS